MSASVSPTSIAAAAAAVMVAVSLSVVAQLRLTACWQSGNLHYTVGHGRLLEVLCHRTS